MDPELEGWWQVFSLAVYSGYERMALEPFLRSERIRVAHVARAHGGFQQGYSEGHAVTLEGAFARDGLVHDQAGAEVPLPAPLPEEPVRPPAGPSWNHGGLGEPTAVVRAVVAAAERIYGGAENAPEVATWLLDEEFAFGEPYETTGEFLGDLSNAVAHQGTCTDATVEAVPFLAELVCDDSIAVGSRLMLLDDLLRLAVSGPSAAVSLTDRTAALGDVWQESAAEYLTRRAISKELPQLLSRWGDESDAVRFALAALVAVCDGHDQHLPARLAELPAPEGTGRADVVALIAALLSGEREHLKSALDRLCSWMPRIAEKAASPHVESQSLALSVLPDLVTGDVASSTTQAEPDLS
ncbi:hypothetical protein ACWGCI_10640 [Streptomyces sp. NPDC054949]